ncbi:MAG: ROK family protein [Candidatus Daviesbacteria bacterium]|nr:ROK family protein [Candidatus Daviesbacteria bacterium]
MYLSFDIGGTNMRLATSSDGETFAGSKIIPTPKDFNEGMKTLKQTADELSHGEKIIGIAGGVAGPLDKEKTMLVTSPHIPGWINKPLKTELETVFDCKVILENDTATGGIGEAVKGAGIGKEIVGYIAIGTGVGGKRIVNGKISNDSFNFEPGHQIIVPDGNLCNCGGKGHMEAYVSGSYFEKMYGQKGEDITDPKIWDEISRYLAISLVNTTVHWTPDIIILGGGVSKSIPLEKVKTYLSEFLTIFPQAPEVVKATLGHDAGLYGALYLLTNN